MEERKLKRKIRIRSKIQGTKERPRLSVFRSNKYIYAQLINDEKGETIVGLSQKDKKGSKIDNSKSLGLSLAKLALSKKIKKAIFDKGSYAYHGRVKAVAEGAREGGLKF